MGACAQESRPRTSPYLPAIRLDVTHEPQSQLCDAVPHCVSMALGFQKWHASIAWLAELLGTDECDGTPGERLTRLHHWGVQVEMPQELQFFRDGTLELNHRLRLGPARLVYRWEERWLEYITQALREGVPPVLFVNVGRLYPRWRGLGQAHAVVLAGGEGRYAWIHDPARDEGPVRVGLHSVMDALLPGEPLAAVLRYRGPRRSLHLDGGEGAG
jgi:hypothetical protein